MEVNAQDHQRELAIGIASTARVSVVATNQLEITTAHGKVLFLLLMSLASNVNYHSR